MKQMTYTFLLATIVTFSLTFIKNQVKLTKTNGHLLESYFMKSHSFFLFARPSFLSGLARLLDFGGTLKIYNEYDVPDNADMRAFAEDWRALGLDFRTALDRYEIETHA